MAAAEEVAPPAVPSFPLPRSSFPPARPSCHVSRDERPSSCSGTAMGSHHAAKYLVPEWHRRNARVLQSSALAGQQSERGRAEAKQFSKDATASAQHAQQHSRRALEQRLQDVHFWRVELQKEVVGLDAENELLAAQKVRLQRALDATEVPFAVVNDNLQCRERRQPPDLVADEVERELLKEVDLIRNIQDLLKRTITEATDQIWANRVQKELCELDWSDKEETYHIDDKCVAYSNDSTNIQFHPSSIKFEEGASTPKTWAQFSHDNVSKAEELKLASVQLRSLISNIIEDVSEKLRRQRAAGNTAFATHCRELSDAKTRLEQHLEKILKDIGEEEATIAALKDSIREKETHLKVAHARLYDRSFRPNIDLCRDEPQFRLVNEVEELRVLLEALKRKLVECEQHLKELEETRMELEKEVAVKANSIFIDRDKCLSNRLRSPVELQVAAYQP